MVFTQLRAESFNFVFSGQTHAWTTAGGLWIAHTSMLPKGKEGLCFLSENVALEMMLVEKSFFWLFFSLRSQTSQVWSQGKEISRLRLMWIQAPVQYFGPGEKKYWEIYSQTTHGMLFSSFWFTKLAVRRLSREWLIASCDDCHISMY